MSIRRARITLSVNKQRGGFRAIFTDTVSSIPNLSISTCNASAVLDIRQIVWAHTFVICPIVNPGFRARFTGFQVLIPELISFALNTFFSIPVRIIFWAIASRIDELLFVEELGGGTTDK